MLDENTIVSMNLWGFTSDYFDYSEKYFRDFLKTNMTNLKSEYFIPFVVDKLITDGIVSVKVYSTQSEWFGITYPEDRPQVVAKLEQLTEEGKYPSKLF